MSLFSKTVLKATSNPLVTRAVTATTPGRSLSERFVAGDDLDAVTSVAGDLNRDGLEVSLDLLGEEVHDRTSAMAAADQYLGAIDRIDAEALDANLSVKLTQLGLAFDAALARQSIDRLARRAAEVGTTVTIDMESSRFVSATVDLYEAAQAEHGNLGVCLQAYLRRTPDDLERLAPLGGHIRLCKGAYVEPPEIAFQTRAEVSAAFARLLEPLMADERLRPAIATHDDALIDLAKRFGAYRTRGWEFQMLYGVRPELQRSLAADAYDMRVYVPYGSEWYPYLTRRLAERPANLAFFARALIGRN